MSARGDEKRWSAVVARDRAQNGKFVYAVRTTGVYCKPSCASRRALRENVRFFAGPDEAERAGFRACKRCDPRASTSATDQLIARARVYLDAHVDERPTLAQLAAAVGLSPSHLQRTFMREVGLSPRQYTAALRAERLKSRLRSGATVSRATFDAGYGASSRAYEAAGLGMTPGAYRRGGEGAHIRFITAATSLGRVLVAATDQGVCAVYLGDDDAALEDALSAEYPRSSRARVRKGHEDLREWLEAVRSYVEGAKRELRVPLDVQGTPFQKRVWESLQRIPYGETRTYSQVAESIAAPAAVRAVASACARNHVSLVIPCHRVVRRTGALGGYRWGLARKEQLLARERGASPRKES